MIASGHSMISIAAITARPAYQPRRGCGRWVAFRECGMAVLRRRVALRRRLRRGFTSSRGFVSTTRSAFISARPPPSRRRAAHGLGQLISHVSLRALTSPSACPGRRPPLILQRVPKSQPKNEEHERDRADREERVSRYPEPPQGLHEALAEELTAAGIPVAVLDRGHGLQKSDREQAQHDH